MEGWSRLGFANPPNQNDKIVGVKVQIFFLFFSLMIHMYHTYNQLINIKGFCDASPERGKKERGDE